MLWFLKTTNKNLMKKNSNGFTLIELIVVITIISIMAAFISIRSTGTSSFTLNGAIKNLLLDVRLTKTLSMSLSSHYRIVLLSSSYEIQDASATPFFNLAAESTTTSLSSEIRISSLTTVIFNSLGQPVDVSNNLLTTSTTITMTDGTNNRNIIIEPQTGFIHE